MTFGNRLKEWRTSKGLSQKEVALTLGIDAPMYSRVEKGERRIKRETLTKVAELYGISIKTLINLWIADKVYGMLSEEDDVKEILSIIVDEFKN